MKTVTIHQPDFLPWPGFFNRWKQADLFVILDDVQFIRRGWHHRDKIKTASGVKWLTIPVRKKGKYTQSIHRVQIDHQTSWISNHLNLLSNAYRHAPRFEHVMNELVPIYKKKDALLIDFNMSMLQYVAQELRITTPVMRSSELNIHSKGTQRLIDITQTVDGKRYLTGHGCKDYLDEDLFRQYQLDLSWQKFQCPVYPQLHGSFEPNLSIIDMLFNLSPEEIIPVL